MFKNLNPKKKIDFIDQNIENKATFLNIRYSQLNHTFNRYKLNIKNSAFEKVFNLILIFKKPRNN